MNSPTNSGFLARIIETVTAWHERSRERQTSLPIPSPWSRTSDRRTASGPALHAGLRRHPFPSPVTSQSSVTLPGSGAGGSNQQLEFA